MKGKIKVGGWIRQKEASTTWKEGRIHSEREGRGRVMHRERNGAQGTLRMFEKQEQAYYFICILKNT